MNPNYIIEITEAEAHKLLTDLREIFVGEARPWGGLFIYQTTVREHPRRTRWIAIDDSDGHCYMKEFRKREGAYQWLLNPAGPKTVRM